MKSPHNSTQTALESSIRISGCKRKLLIAIYAMIALLALPCLASDLQAAPEMRVDTSEFVFGQLPQNTTVSHTFWIYSIGQDTLIIDSVIAGCGCMTIPLKNKILAPGDSVPFEILFNSAGIIGNIVKKPAFRTNASPEWQYFKFYGAAITKMSEYFPLVAAPPLFDFTSYAGEPSYELGFVLENISDETLTLKLVDQPPGLVSLKIPGTLKPHQKYQGRVTLASPYRMGAFRKSLTIEANNSPLYRLSIPLFRDESKPVNPDSASTIKK